MICIVAEDLKSSKQYASAPSLVTDSFCNSKCVDEIELCSKLSRQVKPKFNNLKQKQNRNYKILLQFK